MIRPMNEFDEFHGRRRRGDESAEDEGDVRRDEQEFAEDAHRISKKQLDQSYERTRRIGASAMRDRLAKMSERDGASFAIPDAGVLWSVEIPKEMLDLDEFERSFLSDAPRIHEWINHAARTLSSPDKEGESA